NRQRLAQWNPQVSAFFWLYCSHRRRRLSAKCWLHPSQRLLEQPCSFVFFVQFHYVPFLSCPWSASCLVVLSTRSPPSLLIALTSCNRSTPGRPATFPAFFAGATNCSGSRSA